MNKELLKLLEKLWKKSPEERFGQLLFNHTRIGTVIETLKIADPFYYDDEDIIKDLEKEIDKLLKEKQ